VDARVVDEVRNEGGHHINSQNDVGGWPVLNSTAAPADTDGDGIPDEWETGRGLNPADAADGRAITASGYSNLERYLNDIVPVPGVDPSTDDAAPAASATLSQGANAAGWHNSDVTVRLDAADNDGGSGLREITYSVNGAFAYATSPSVTIPVNVEGTTTITFYAADLAGNTGAAQQIIVKLDKTAPVVGTSRAPEANANGWNNTDVVAGYSATDALSGFGDGPEESGAYTFGGEGAGQSFTFRVTDLAGNAASATVADVSIDKTAPVVHLRRPVEGAFYPLGQAALADYDCADNLSGLGSCAGTVAANSRFDTATVGAKTFNVAAADLAGNTAARAVVYTVGYSLNLLYDANKVHRAGSTVPVKLQLFDGAGANLSSAANVLRAVGVSLVTSDTSGPATDAGDSNPDSDFRFDPSLGGTGGYQFNLKTDGLATGTYRLSFTVGGDPHVYAAQFQIR
jgi:hypothetical protein